MAARTSMSELITRCRRMIGDDGATSQFTDDQIQDVFDQHRSTFRYFPLCEIEDIAPYGTVSYKEFWAASPSDSLYQHWEGTAGGSTLIFVDGQYGTITPNVLNCLEGKFRFTTAPTYRPVYLTGYNYDIFGVCCQLLDEWAAHLKRCVDASEGNQKVFLSQQFAMVSAQSDKYRRMMRPKQVSMIRADIAPVQPERTGSYTGRE